jgi:uncharacterized membrane protein YjjB (DUF3815 family)
MRRGSTSEAFDPAAPAERSAWWYAVPSALLGVALAAVAGRHLGLPGILAAMIATLFGAALGARVLGRHAPSEVIAFTFAAIMLTWPWLLTAVLLLTSHSTD